MAIVSSEITALILCGGQAIRMGGEDKGLLLVKNKTLVEWTINRVQSSVNRIIINANRNQSKYEALGFTTIADASIDYLGPLAGFQVGLIHSQTPYVLILPCDTPLFPVNLATQLAIAMEDNQVDCTYAVSMENDLEQAHPVFCLLKKSTLNSLQQFMQTGQRKIDKWFQSLNHQKVLFEDPKAFINVNSHHELLLVEKLL